MATQGRTSTVRRRILQVEGGRSRPWDDVLVVEEPLEIRLYPNEGDPREYVSVAVTMRTPGSDFELAAGFLYTEGIISHRQQVKAIAYCGQLPGTFGPRTPEERYNIANVYLRDAGPGGPVSHRLERLQRHFYTTSSCGICGKASLEAVRVMGVRPVTDDVRVGADVLASLDERMRGAQSVFEQTGGLHAAAWFDAAGNLLAMREDVGRHNAVDKLIGYAFLEDRLPLRRSILMVSGRASFEIVQKAAAAGVPVVAAISAPSSLACDAAAEFGITLVGFLRGPRFNVYTVPQRIVL